MDRKKINELFLEGDKYSIAKIIEDIELALNIEYIVYSKEFYTPNIWNKITENSNKFGFKTSCLGLTEESEKKVIAIYPNDFQIELFPLSFPIKYFKIDGSNKFKELHHKDFLGTIMSLGIKRELLGDLIVENNICYGIVLEEIYDIIKKNIKIIGKISVEFFEISPLEIPKAKFKESLETVSSLRIDCVVSEILKISRNKAVEIIENGEVLINYEIEKNKSYQIKKNNIITIKKKGKFVFKENLGHTKKDKIKIKINQFI